MTWRQGLAALAIALPVLGGDPLGVAPSAYAAPDAAAPASPAASSILLDVDEEEILILEVMVERYRASQGILGYRHGDRVLLPVGELAAVLEMAVTADPYTGTADGWISTEDNVFRLDVAGRSVTIGDRQLGIDEPCVYVDADDIYVASDVLSAWWPVAVEVDLRGMRVTLEASEPVPLVSRLEREQAWENLSRGDRQGKSYPRQKGEYRALSWPFLDATVAWDANRERSVVDGSLLARGDLLRMSVTGFAGYDDESDRQWTGWLRAERSDPDGGLLGPLGATRVQVGDVIGRPSPYVKSTTRGRGLLVSNRPLGAVTRFDVTDVTGDAPPGWEAELYRDGYLHDIQTVGERGSYLFEDIPIHPGINTLRVVLYGPNGQTREEVRTVNITSSMWQPGHLVYEALSQQSGESVVGTPTSTYPPPDKGQWIHSLGLGYGLAQGTSLDLTALRRWVDGDDRDYLSGRVLQSLDRVLFEGRLVKDLDGGQVLGASAQTRLGSHSLLLSHARFRDFHSDESRYEQNLSHLSELRLSGALRPAGRNLLSYRLRWQGDAFDGGRVDRRDLLQAYLGRTFGRFQLGHDLDYARASGTGAEEEALQGRLQASGFVRGVRVRLDTDYDLMGDPGINAVGLGVNWQPTVDLSAQLSARRLLRGAGSTSIQANLDWHLRAVRLGLRAGYDTETEHYMGVSATTSLARAPGGSWHLSSRSATRHGAAMVQAFIDHDGDGTFGAGDEPLPGVSFGRNQLWRDIETDADGAAFLPGLPADRFANVLVNVESVEDPYLVTSTEGLTTLVHAGGVASLDFPFQVVGEVEGMVIERPSNRPLRNVGLELVDGAGERVAATVSEFDGYYLFGRVTPGDYQVRVVMATLHDGRYEEPAPAAVHVPAGGDYVSGPTIDLVRLDVPEEEPPVVEVVVEPEPEPEVEPESAPEPASAAAADPVTVAAVEPAVEPTSPAPEAVPGPDASRPRLDPAPSVDLDPEVRRTMHLIRELLYESSLFER
ncbi:hypothetical protein GF314_17165 [bacterium]|nr:hypothetical protein [bacterium]